MSKHYTAFQYDAAYKPTALRNWEVPKYVCNRPRQRMGMTKIIANAMGNLLPGVHRSEESPWGNFIGTWSMPRKIDRKTAATINGSADHKMKANKCYLHYTAKPISRHECEEDSTGKSESESKPESVGKVKCTEVQEETPGEQEVTDKEEIVDERETVTKPLCPIHDY